MCETGTKQQLKARVRLWSDTIKQRVNFSVSLTLSALMGCAMIGQSRAELWPTALALLLIFYP